MKITKIQDGLWDVDGCGELERTALGDFWRALKPGSRLSGEQIAQLDRFIQDEKRATD